MSLSGTIVSEDGGPSAGHQPAAASKTAPEVLVPLDSEEEVAPTLEAVRFVYTGQLNVNTFQDLWAVRKQADYLQIDDCVEACDAAMRARFGSGGTGTAAAACPSPSPLSPVLELYDSRDLLPEGEPHIAALRLACLNCLGRNWEAPLPAAQGGPSKVQLMMWLLGNTVRVANSKELSAAFVTLPEAVIEALMASDEFSTDNEATVAVLLKQWLDKNRPHPHTQQRLVRLIRVLHLGSPYLTFIAHQMPWLDMSAGEMLFAQRLAAACGEESNGLRALGAYDCSAPRYAGPRRQAIPEAGIKFDWRLDLQGVQEVAAAGAETVMVQCKLPVQESGSTSITAGGLNWGLKLSYSQGRNAAGLWLHCGVPGAGAPGGDVQGAGSIVALVTVHRWRNGHRRKPKVLQFEAVDFFKFGRSRGAFALELRPVAVMGVAENGADQVARWAEYLYDGGITGTLIICPPGFRIA